MVEADDGACVVVGDAVVEGGGSDVVVADVDAGSEGEGVADDTGAVVGSVVDAGMDTVVDAGGAMVSQPYQPRQAAIPFPSRTSLEG